GKVIAPDAAWGAAMHAMEVMLKHDPKNAGLVLDSGVPKIEPEWLLIGRAYAPEGTSITQKLVSITFANTKREFLLETNTPFASYPLTWKDTWGGKSENPEGLAITQVKRAPLTARNEPFGTPACPAPRGAWPCRMQNMGTYDAAWLKYRWPDGPDDFDWAFYNLAQKAQRLPQGINGDEPYTLLGLHPKEQNISGHLPGKTLRFFVQRDQEYLEHAVSCDTVLFFPNELVGIILWHALVSCLDEKGSDILALKAQIIPEESLPEEAVILEDFSEPEADTLEDLEAEDLEALAAPQDDQDALAALKKAPEADIPKFELPPPVDHKAQLQKAFTENLPEINKGLAEAGVPPLTQAQIASTRKKLDEIAAQMQEFDALTRAQAATKEPTVAEVLKNFGLPADAIKNVDKALNLPKPNPALAKNAAEWEVLVDKYLAQFNAILKPSPSTLETMRTSMIFQGPGGQKLMAKSAGDPTQNTIDAFVKAGMSPEKANSFMQALDSDIPKDPAGIKAYATRLEQIAGFAPGSISNKIAEFDAMIKNLHLPTLEDLAQKANVTLPNEPQAKLPPKPPLPDLPKATPADDAPDAAPKDADLRPPKDRKSFIAWVVAEKSLKGLVLANLDLSLLDLSNLDMEGCDLTGSNLSQSKLLGTNLTKAILAETDCTETDFSGANLTSASLAKACVTSALFAETNLAKCDATAINASDALFSEAILDEAILTKGSFQGTTFQNISAANLNASEADFTDARFRFAQMPKAIFMKANLKGSDIHACNLAAANLQEANLDEASVCVGTSVQGADLTSATMNGGSWTEVDGSLAKFLKVSATDATLSDSDFTGSNWRGASLRLGDFSRSNLQSADMQGCDLFEGSLHEANLGSTNLKGANLYGVDLARITQNPGTIFDGADLTNTIIKARETFK
ncbi:MAG: pentapeptide repeat-containing protein, partial [Desulfovibrionaceae bacterium]|nr:pentapeptide repeat-containing protein [Desulfovibrionaceae bacterium]